MNKRKRDGTQETAPEQTVEKATEKFYYFLGDDLFIHLMATPLI